MDAALHRGSERARRRPFAIEWLYFKFFTPTVDGIVVYGCGWGMPGVMSAEVFRYAGGTFAPPKRVVRHDYGRGEVWRATTSFDCGVGGCTVASDGGDLVAVGAVAESGHTIDWQLRVTPRYPAFASFAGPGGWLPGGSLHWYLLAPLADVTGQVLVDGAAVPVDGSGYVDSNCGRWLFALDPTTQTSGRTSTARPSRRARCVARCRPASSGSSPSASSRRRGRSRGPAAAAPSRPAGSRSTR